MIVRRFLLCILEIVLFWIAQLGKCAFLFSENTHFDLVKLKKYQVKSLFKKAHFPSCANSQFAVTSFSMGVFGSRSQEGRDLLR